MSTVTVTRCKATIPGEIRWYPEAASQSFKKGQFVYLSAAGKLTACASNATGCCGLAEADASGTTDTAIPVTIAKRGQQYTVFVTNGGSATTTAVSQVGKQYDIYVASNVCYLNTAGTSQRFFTVDALASEDTVGDTNGRLVVEVRGIYAQLDSGTS